MRRSPIGLTLQAFTAAVIWPYYHSAYRIRGWGRLPRRRGATLVLVNHQHPLDTHASLAYLALGGPIDRPVYAVSGRRLFERGFMGHELPWLEAPLRRFDQAGLFRALGVLPIENQLRTRAIASFAHTIVDLHGDVPIARVFAPAALIALAAIDPHVRTKTLSHLFTPSIFRPALDLEIPLEWLEQPYRNEVLAHMREQLDADFMRIEDVLRESGTLWLTPEGRYSTSGRIDRFRMALPRLTPLADAIYTFGISYDVFAGPRLAQIFNLIPAIDRGDLPASLKAARPVTVSQLLADWLTRENVRSFQTEDASHAVRQRLSALPPRAFVEPELRAAPAKITTGALRHLQRLSFLNVCANGWELGRERVHPHFPKVADMLAFQAIMFGETLEALHKLDAPQVREQAGLDRHAVARS